MIDERAGGECESVDVGGGAGEGDGTVGFCREGKETDVVGSINFGGEGELRIETESIIVLDLHEARLSLMHI